MLDYLDLKTAARCNLCGLRGQGFLCKAQLSLCIASLLANNSSVACASLPTHHSEGLGEVFSLIEPCSAASLCAAAEL